MFLTNLKNNILNFIAKIFSFIINVQYSGLFSYLFRLVLIVWVVLIYSLNKWIAVSRSLMVVFAYYLLPIIITFLCFLIIILVLLQRGHDGVFSQAISNSYTDSDSMSLYTINVCVAFLIHVFLNNILLMRLYNL